MKKVITYIDGFNLYFGLKDKYGRKYYWLDLYKLSCRLLKKGQELISVKYFTSRIENPEDKRKRQNKYLEALKAKDNIQIYFGKYHTNHIKCPKCQSIINLPSEKETDVNIAVEILTDAVNDNYDTALIISGDSDLVPAIRRAKELFPTKRFISVFPPKRSSFELRYISDGYFTISENNIRNSQLEHSFLIKDGLLITKPNEWN